MAEVEIPNWLKRLPLAPVYHPTETEFSDPIAFISKIEKEASSYGMCKIVPPLPKPSKRYVFANLNKSLAKSLEICDGLPSPAGRNAGDEGGTRAVFTTRNQELGSQSSKKTKGQCQWAVQKQVWQSGEMYTLEQFESKSRNFSRARLGMLKDVSPLVLESLFWKAASEKPIYIEYANDVPGSGFGEPEGAPCFLNNRGRKRRLGRKHMRTVVKREKRLRAEDNSIRTDSATAVSVEGNNHIGISESLESCHVTSSVTADEVQEEMHGTINSSSNREGTAGRRLSNSPWNLQVIARSYGSLTRYMPDEVPGVTSPMVYIGMLFSWFAWHVEDHELHSLNFLHTGSPKTWYAVPGDYASSFEEVIRVQGYGGQLGRAAAFAVLGEKTTLLSPEVVVESGVPCCRLVQNPGEFVVTFPRAYHVGFSHGFNCGEAANFATTQWLKIAKEAAIRRAAMNYLPMLSHQQLLYMLALSFVLRTPGLDHVEIRHSRLQDRKREREMEVKRAFIDDVTTENKLLDALLRKTSSCAVLWDPEQLPSSPISQPLALCSAEEHDQPVKGRSLDIVPSNCCEINSFGCIKNDSCIQDSSIGEPPSLADYTSVLEIPVKCEQEKDSCGYSVEPGQSLNDKFGSSGLHLDSGALACVACGILGFPCMVIIQPSDEAVKVLFPDLEEQSNQQISVEPDDLHEVDAEPKTLVVSSKDIRVIPSTISGDCQKHSEPVACKSGCFTESVVPSLSTKEAVESNSDCKNSFLDLDKAHAADVSSLEIVDHKRSEISTQSVASYSLLNHSVDHNGGTLDEKYSHHQEESDLTLPSAKDNADMLTASEDVLPQRLENKFENILLEGLNDVEGSTKGTLLNACAEVNNTLPNMMEVDVLTNNCSKEVECHKSLAGNNQKLRYLWNLSKDFLRPQVFCLEHALKVVEMLTKKGGANVLVICHSDYPKIVEGAMSVAAEVGADFCIKDVPLVNASNADLDLINYSVDDERKEGSEDWSSRLGVNMQHHCMLNKIKASSGESFSIVSVNELFCDSQELDAPTEDISDAVPSASSLKWHVRKTRTHQRRNSMKNSEVEANVSAEDNDTLLVKQDGEINRKAPFLQYCRRRKKGQGPHRSWDLDIFPSEAVSGHGNLCALEVQGLTEVTDVNMGASGDGYCSKIDREGDTLAVSPSTTGSSLEVSEWVNEAVERALSSKGCEGMAGSTERIHRQGSTEACDLTIDTKQNESKGRNRKGEISARSDIVQFIRGPCEGLRPRRPSSVSGSSDMNVNTSKVAKARQRARAQRKVSLEDEDENLLKCNIDGCNMSFRTRAELLSHEGNRCTIRGCGKCFSSHKYMLKHQRVHEEDRPLKCPWKGCRMSFKWAWARTEHLRVHSGERPYVCKHAGCGQTFRFVSDFSRHKRKTGHSRK